MAIKFMTPMVILAFIIMAAVTVFYAEKYDAVGDGNQDSTKVDGIINAIQNPESEKNIKKWLQFVEVEGSTVMGRGLIDGNGEKPFMQTSAATVEKVVKGRTLLEPTKPSPNTGGDPQHN